MVCTIFDYGVGNLHSLRHALESVGAKVKVTDSARELQDAERIVLPGVGAFGPASERLAPAYDFLVSSKAPVLGICLGMQLMYRDSAESPDAEGLGIVPESIMAMPGKTPAIGWNQLNGPDEWVDGQHYYFVHSFGAQVGPWTTATADHNSTVTAIVRKQNFTGVQFHPEKSGQAGLAMLKRWLA